MAPPKPEQVVGAKRLQAEHGLVTRYDNKCSISSSKPPLTDFGSGEGGSVPTWDQNPSSEPPSIDKEDEFYIKIQVGTCCELVSDLAVCFDNDSINQITTGKRVPLRGPYDILIIGDPIHKPAEIAVLPKTQTLAPGKEIFISVMCLDYSYWLQAGIPIAQAFLLPKHLPDIVPENPTVLMGADHGYKKTHREVQFVF